MHKLSLRNKVLISFLVLVVLLTYFFINFYIFKPNVLTWFSDEYEYVSQARNYALFSNLETSFYSAKAALEGNFPSLGYHPILFSFLMGLLLKLFKASPNTIFVFNYLLALATVIIMFFYSRQRLKVKEIVYPVLILALFPIFVLYMNIQSPELFFICLVKNDAGNNA